MSKLILKICLSLLGLVSISLCFDSILSGSLMLISTAFFYYYFSTIEWTFVKIEKSKFWLVIFGGALVSLCLFLASNPTKKIEQRQKKLSIDDINHLKLKNFETKWASIILKNYSNYILTRKLVSKNCDTIYFETNKKDTKERTLFENILTKNFDSTLTSNFKNEFKGFTVNIILINKSEKKMDSKFDEERQKYVHSQFKGYNSSNYLLEEYLKYHMVHPKSYQHIETTYTYSDSLIYITTYFKGAGKFANEKTNFAFAVIDNSEKIIDFRCDCRSLLNK